MANYIMEVANSSLFELKGSLSPAQREKGNVLVYKISTGFDSCLRYRLITFLAFTASSDIVLFSSCLPTVNSSSPNFDDDSQCTRQVSARDKSVHATSEVHATSQCTLQVKCTRQVSARDKSVHATSQCTRQVSARDKSVHATSQCTQQVKCTRQVSARDKSVHTTSPCTREVSARDESVHATSEV